MGPFALFTTNTNSLPAVSSAVIHKRINTEFTRSHLLGIAQSSIPISQTNKSPQQLILIRTPMVILIISHAIQHWFPFLSNI